MWTLFSARYPRVTAVSQVLVTATPSRLSEASPKGHLITHSPSYYVMPLLSLQLLRGTMSDKSDLKAELERKKQRLAQIREEKKRKEEERKKKEVRKKVSKVTQLAPILYCTLACTVCVSDCFLSGHDTWTAELVCVSIRAYKTSICVQKVGAGTLSSKCACSELSLTDGGWADCFLCIPSSRRASRRERRPPRIQTWTGSAGRPRPCCRVLASHLSLLWVHHTLIH